MGFFPNLNRCRSHIPGRNDNYSRPRTSHFFLYGIHGDRPTMSPSIHQLSAIFSLTFMASPTFLTLPPTSTSPLSSFNTFPPLISWEYGRLTRCSGSSCVSLKQWSHIPAETSSGFSDGEISSLLLDLHLQDIDTAVSSSFPSCFFSSSFSSSNFNHILNTLINIVGFSCSSSTSMSEIQIPTTTTTTTIIGVTNDDSHLHIFEQNIFFLMAIIVTVILVGEVLVNDIQQLRSSQKFPLNLSQNEIEISIVEKQDQNSKLEEVE